MNIFIVYNPVAGRRHRRRLEELERLLCERGHRVEVRVTGERGDAREIARTAEGIDVLVAAGGDGTVNEIVDGLTARDSADGAPAVGFLPLGTANVLAWELDLPRSPRGLVRLIESGERIVFRPGIANGHRFVLMASTGLDARAVAAVRLRTKRLLGGIAYVSAALRSLRRALPACGVTIGDTAYSARTVIVTRVRHYGGPFVLVPEAGFGAGLLYVVLLQSQGWFATTRYGLALLLGRLGHLDDVTIVATDRVEIRGEAGEPVQMDGDIAAALPLSIRVDERQIALLAPTTAR